ncbi:hypothetical protein, partial [uncultured Gordonia sp.]|uniref:hypothetical protein n=1 Tax=uncultured Gordonia sp. TaxID=198437 RepID=UPI00259AC2AF
PAGSKAFHSANARASTPKATHAARTNFMGRTLLAQNALRMVQRPLHQRLRNGVTEDAAVSVSR